MEKAVWGGIEFCKVPAGPFLMGSEPQHVVNIPYDYWMARLLVTNEQFTQYARTWIPPDFYWQKRKNDSPATWVRWTEAMAYCKWLNIILAERKPKELVIRLPTEAEWEKAARGTDGREYPWGNSFDKHKCNVGRDFGLALPSSVGLYSPIGDSPYGCADMVGFVNQWCHSLYKPSPYKSYDGREDEAASGDRVKRGGTCIRAGEGTRCSDRGSMAPDNYSDGTGFRLVLSPFPRKRGVLDLLRLRTPLWPSW